MEIEGLIFSNNKFRDFDSMCTAILPKCKLAFLARGILKIGSKNSPSVAPFSFSKLEVMKTKDGYSLKRGTLLNDYSNIKSSLDGLLALNLISEFLSLPISNEEISTLYPCLIKTLDFMNNKGNYYFYLTLLWAEFLTVLGYKLNTDSCVKCGRKDELIAASAFSGGFICKDCFNKSKDYLVSLDFISTLKMIFEGRTEELESLMLNEIKFIKILIFLNEFTYNHLNFKFKTIEKIKKVHL